MDGRCVKRGLRTVECGLQTGGKMQTEGKMQTTSDYRLFNVCHNVSIIKC